MKFDVMNFSYGDRAVEVMFDDDRNPWWIANYVCKVIGLDNVGRAIDRLDDDEKLTRKIFRSGQRREMWTINESGLYSLILRSNKPEAKRFKRWITHVVLPAIRRSGQYKHDSATRSDAAIDQNTIPLHPPKKGFYFIQKEFYGLIRLGKNMGMSGNVLQSWAREMVHDYYGIDLSSLAFEHENQPKVAGVSEAVKEFAADRLCFDSQMSIHTVDLWDGFNSWCKVNGYAPVPCTKGRFYRFIHILFPSVVRRQLGEKRLVYFCGIGWQEH